MIFFQRNSLLSKHNLLKNLSFLLGFGGHGSHAITWCIPRAATAEGVGSGVSLSSSPPFRSIP